MLFVESLIGVLAAFGLICLLWEVRSMMFRGNASLEVQAVIPVQGEGEALEHTVRSLLRLRKAGLWHGTVVVRDDGLTPEGAALARKVCSLDGVQFSQLASA